MTIPKKNLGLTRTATAIGLLSVASLFIFSEYQTFRGRGVGTQPNLTMGSRFSRDSERLALSLEAEWRKHGDTPHFATLGLRPLLLQILEIKGHSRKLFPNLEHYQNLRFVNFGKDGFLLAETPNPSLDHTDAGSTWIFSGLKGWLLSEPLTVEESFKEELSEALSFDPLKSRTLLPTIFRETNPLALEQWVQISSKFSEQNMSTPLLSCHALPAQTRLLKLKGNTDSSCFTRSWKNIDQGRLEITTRMACVNPLEKKFHMPHIGRIDLVLPSSRAGVYYLIDSQYSKPRLFEANLNEFEVTAQQAEVDLNTPAGSHQASLPQEFTTYACMDSQKTPPAPLFYLIMDTEVAQGRAGLDPKNDLLTIASEKDGELVFENRPWSQFASGSSDILSSLNPFCALRSPIDFRCGIATLNTAAQLADLLIADALLLDTEVQADVIKVAAELLTRTETDLPDWQLSEMVVAFRRFFEKAEKLEHLNLYKLHLASAQLDATEQDLWHLSRLLNPSKSFKGIVSFEKTKDTR